MLPPHRKRAVYDEARAAALRGESLNHACPYPFASDEGRWFKQVHSEFLPVPGDAAGAVLPVVPASSPDAAAGETLIDTSLHGDPR